MSDTPSAPNVLLTSADIQRWENDVIRISKEIEQLTSERDAIGKRLEVAKLFAQLVPETTQAVETPAPSVAPLANAAPKRRRKPVSPWPSAIMAAVKPADMGLTFAELREALMNTPLAAKLEASSKAYHNALTRLDKRDKKIVREFGRVFTPAAFARFEQALQSGEVSTDAARPFAHSPMGTAILKLVGASPGITSSTIVAELRKDAEFNAALTPHKTGAFNIIARLARRQQVVRRDDGGLNPGPKFPKDLVGHVPDEVGALNGNAASAPIAGEVAASPIETQSSLRLVR